MQMASKDYDSLIGFAPEYKPMKEDFEHNESIAGGPIGNFDLFVFYEQPIVRIGEISLEDRFISTSNVMLLGSEETDEGEIWFPYMEAIEVKGEPIDVMNFSREIYNLYVKKNRWKMHLHETPINRRKVRSLTDRFDCIDILRHEEVIKLARNKLSFDANKISWEN